MMAAIIMAGRTGAAYAAQLDIKKAEIEQAKSEVGFRENHTRTSRDLVNRMEKLAKQGGESQVEFIKLRLELAGSEKDLSVAQRTLHLRAANDELVEVSKIVGRLGVRSKPYQLSAKLRAGAADRNFPGRKF